jgi:ADP-sugar diphosphatase
MAASRPHLDLTDYPGLPSTPVYLPHNLTEDQFLRLLPKDPSTPPAYEFPALQNWLKKLVQNFKLQDNDDHPHYDHPFKLRSIDVQAVDWFSKSRLGFMKIQAEITSDPYGREIGGKAASNWLPGAVFLRGGSVAVLVSTLPPSSCAH